MVYSMIRSLFLLMLCGAPFVSVLQAQESRNENLHVYAEHTDPHAKKKSPSVCHSHADLTFVPFSADKFVDYGAFTWSADSFQVTFKFKNQGGVDFSDALRISFYNGDPRATFRQRTYLGTKTILVSDMAFGDIITTTLKVKNPGDAFNLYIAINDNGTTLPLNITQQPDRVIECAYGNVINQHVEPVPVNESTRPKPIN